MMKNSLKTTFSLRKTARGLVILGALFCAGTLYAQEKPPQPNFHATHYQIDAVLSPGNQTLMAKAQVTLMADRPTHDVNVELNPNLRIDTVMEDQQSLVFQRTDTPLGVVVTLPNTVSPGQQVTLTFAYSGPLSGVTGSPSPGVRLAYIGKNRAYLLLSARWFPLISYVGQHYTATVNLTVPPNYAVVGTGSSSAPSMVAEPQGAKPVGTQQWLQYTFTADKPGDAGTYIAGALELTPITEGGLSFSVYTQPSDKKTAQPYADAIAKIIDFYSSQFGPLPVRNITVAQLPAVAPMNTVFASGLLLVSQRRWSEKPPEDLLARLVAHLFWGETVRPASAADVWLSDGLSRYSQALYVQHARGDATFRQTVDEFAVGALMDEKVASISNAWRLEPYTTAYQSIVRDKGAMVFHMLRTSIGDAAFSSLLREFYRKYQGKTVTLADFEQMTQQKLASLPAPAAGQGPQLNALAFFSQWVNSTGIPQFKLDYIVYRTAKGFKVVGKIEQNLTTMNMPIEMKVETEGNPVTKTVQVIGDTSEFSIDTFGEPKSNGIILDPNDNILKSTPDLRVKAMILQGEALAERGQFFDAVQEYQRALDIQHRNSLALFRMGEAMFYEKNYQAAANSFRDALDGQVDPGSKWIIVWSHVYLGKIYDLIGQRERAMNEYQRAIDTKDNTAGAIDQAREYMRKPYSNPPESSPSN
jgi:aminopeptidase N